MDFICIIYLVNCVRKRDFSFFNTGKLCYIMFYVKEAPETPRSFSCGKVAKVTLYAA